MFIHQSIGFTASWGELEPGCCHRVKGGYTLDMSLVLHRQCCRLSRFFFTYLGTFHILSITFLKKKKKQLEIIQVTSKTNMGERVANIALQGQDLFVCCVWVVHSKEILQSEKKQAAPPTKQSGGSVAGATSQQLTDIYNLEKTFKTFPIPHVLTVQSL